MRVSRKREDIRTMCHAEHSVLREKIQKRKRKKQDKGRKAEAMGKWKQKKKRSHWPSALEVLESSASGKEQQGLGNSWEVRKRRAQQLRGGWGLGHSYPWPEGGNSWRRPALQPDALLWAHPIHSSWDMCGQGQLWMWLNTKSQTY